MNQYKRLLSNTFIFAIGTFSSKILVILMLRFYTGVMTTDEMGVADLIVKTTSILYRGRFALYRTGDHPVRSGTPPPQKRCIHHRPCNHSVRFSHRTAVPPAARV